MNIIIKNPCKKCLIQAACTKLCGIRKQYETRIINIGNFVSKTRILVCFILILGLNLLEGFFNIIIIGSFIYLISSIFIELIIFTKKYSLKTKNEE